MLALQPTLPPRCSGVARMGGLRRHPTPTGYHAKPTRAPAVARQPKPRHNDTLLAPTTVTDTTPMPPPPPQRHILPAHCHHNHH